MSLPLLLLVVVAQWALVLGEFLVRLVVKPALDVALLRVPRLLRAHLALLRPLQVALHVAAALVGVHSLRA